MELQKYVILAMALLAVSNAIASVTTVVNETIFAVISRDGCASNLQYGSDSVEPPSWAYALQSPYFGMKTAYKDIPHKKWRYALTTDGKIEILRIYWYFSTAKTLEQRFVDAVRYGEPVNYVVEVVKGGKYKYSGVWWFSSDAGDMASRFQATATTECCFSSDRGAWGAASGVVDGHYNMPSDFTGTGSFGPSGAACGFIYINGVEHWRPFDNFYNKARLYYSNDAPDPTQQTEVQVTQTVSGLSYSDYFSNSILYDRVIQQTILDTLPGASLSDIKSYQVKGGSSSRRRTLTETTGLRFPSITDQPEPLSSSSSIQLKYKLVLTGLGYSYNDVRSQMQNAVQSGYFTDHLRSNAVTYSASGLSTAQSDSVSTKDLNANDDSLTVPAIIGIVVGGTAVLVAAAMAWRCMHSSSKQEGVYIGACCIVKSRAANTVSAAPVRDAPERTIAGISYYDTAPPATPTQTHTAAASAPSAAAAVGGNGYQAIRMEPRLPEKQIAPSAPVVALAVSGYDHDETGAMVAYAEVYTGEEEAKQ